MFLIVYFIPRHQSQVINRTKDIRQSLANIPEWKQEAFQALDKEIVDSLKLDDYLNADYVRGTSRVSLYIGYYFTGTKVGAAHDPMVCFPGQGWHISGIEKGSMYIDETNVRISYSSMVATRDKRRELIIYWFQAGEVACPDTLKQKLYTFMNKISNKPEENAFVRITMDISAISRQEGEKIIKEFVKDFYPVFLRYIQAVKF